MTLNNWHLERDLKAQYLKKNKHLAKEGDVFKGRKNGRYTYRLQLIDPYSYRGREQLIFQRTDGKCTICILRELVPEFLKRVFCIEDYTRTYYETPLKGKIFKFSAKSRPT